MQQMSSRGIIDGSWRVFKYTSTRVFYAVILPHTEQ